MTTEQAIGLLDSAVSQMKLTREEHNHLTMALKTLVEATAKDDDDGEHDSTGESA